MISDKVYALCTSSESVSDLLAKDPTLAPEDAWKKLFGDNWAGEKESVSTAKANRDEITSEDLKRARECGKWGPTEPSDLFLRVGPLELLMDYSDFHRSTTMLYVQLIEASVDVWSVHR